MKKIKTSGISGNEMYCLIKEGYSPGDIVIGNSVYSLGVLGSITSTLRNLIGGEIYEVTNFIQSGRELAIDRMEAEAVKLGEDGITDVSTEIISHTQNSNIEFLSVGSGVYKKNAENINTSVDGSNISINSNGKLSFSSSIDATELYCNIDAGYDPKKFVFGNVAYSIGAVGGIIGALRTLKRGEVKEYSQVLNHTRHLALERIVKEAKNAGANSVLNIETRIMPYLPGITEMVMIGTASQNSELDPKYSESPISSDLTSTELWSLTKMGYQPLKLVLGTSIYSLGVVGGITSAFKSIFKGEISELTSLVYEARENALGLIRQEAEQIDADDIVGVKTYMHELGGGLIEFMAIGTAIKKVDNLKTKSDELIPQAIIVDKNTFFNESSYFGNVVAKGFANQI